MGPNFQPLQLKPPTLQDFCGSTAVENQSPAPFSKSTKSQFVLIEVKYHLVCVKVLNKLHHLDQLTSPAPTLPPPRLRKGAKQMKITINLHLLTTAVM